MTSQKVESTIRAAFPGLGNQNFTLGRSEFRKVRRLSIETPIDGSLSYFLFPDGGRTALPCTITYPEKVFLSIYKYKKGNGYKKFQANFFQELITTNL